MLSFQGGNMFAPENGWLEDDPASEIGFWSSFQGLCDVSFRESIGYIHFCLMEVTYKLWKGHVNSSSPKKGHENAELPDFLVVIFPPA